MAELVFNDDFDGVRSDLFVDELARTSLTSKTLYKQTKCLPTDSKFSTRFDRATHAPDPCPVYLTPENFDGTPIANADVN